MFQLYQDINELLNRQYSDNNNVKSKTPILRLDLFNYSDTCIVVKVTITVTGANVTIRSNKELALNKSVPFRSCMLIIDDKFMDNACDLGTVMAIFSVTITICHQKAWVTIIEMEWLMMWMKIMVIITG